MDFQQSIPNLDQTTKWFLDETVYCLEKYGGMSTDEACKAVLGSRLIELIKDDPKWMWREPAFHWAMCVLYGFDSYWWHDKHLWEQHNEYVRERHHPPMGE